MDYGFRSPVRALAVALEVDRVELYYPRRGYSDVRMTRADTYDFMRGNSRLVIIIQYH